jgi:hypothetical protein
MKLDAILWDDDGTLVISVAAAYSRSAPLHWKSKPDYIVTNVEDLLSIIGKYA